MRTTFENPSQAFAHRLRSVRGAQDMSAQRLVELLAERGFTMQRNAITKIETQKGRTTVTLDEAVAIADALATPLPLLLAPVDVADAEVYVTPKKKLNAWRFLDQLMTGRGAGRLPWFTGERIAHLYRVLVQQQDDLRTCMERVKEAEYLDDEQAVRRAKRAAVKSYRGLERTVEDLEGHGLADTGELIPSEAHEMVTAIKVED